MTEYRIHVHLPADQPGLSRKYRLVSTCDWSVGGKAAADWLVYVFSKRRAYEWK